MAQNTKKEEKSVKVVAQNKKARHDYFIEKSFEAGIELFGTEVKSIREGRVNLKDSFISIDKGEAFINGMHISPYDKGSFSNSDPLRKRKLLLHKAEINSLLGLSMQQGYAIIPLQVYFKGSKAKIEAALAKGKKLYDKREDAARRDAKRDIDRTLKERNR